MSDEVQRSLGRIEGKLDTLAETLTTHLENDKDEFARLHGRVNRVASKQSWMLGGAAGIGAAVSAVVAYLKG